jgi:hypothetical protein
MADNDFRSYRSRDPLPRDSDPLASEEESDPLAELARLIGQSDPYIERSRPDPYSSGRSGETAEGARSEWSDDKSYAHRQDPAEDRYAPPPALPSAASYQTRAPQRPDDDREPRDDRYFAGPAAQFSGFREEANADYRGEPAPIPHIRELPAYATEESEQDYGAQDAEHQGGEAYAQEDYYDDRPSERRRSGIVILMAVFALAVVGTAGAFGYRAMFGGSILPTLPPIIKASNGPNKILPSYGESQANNSSQAGAASSSSSENLVSREEQPVNMEPPKAPRRVVSTIPIVSGQSPGSPSVAASSAPTANSPPPPGPSPWPANPLSTPTAAMAPPTSAPAPVPAPVLVEPKKVHTVVVRADQPGGPDAMASAPTPPPAPAVRPTPRPAVAAPRPSASPPAAASNAPLSIVPGASGEPAAPAPTRTAAPAPMTVASAAPAGAAVASASGGGYSVQVSSQRSEAEAQAAFRELRAKFPNQLNGREPIIRRADLGAKGTYYRALVGPFASMEAAAGLCSGLKAAGANCLVQRN